MSHAPQLPSSFASAAAGQSNRDSRGGRDGRGNGSADWGTRGRSANSTAVFRRSSTTPFNNQSTTLPSNASPDGPAAVQPIAAAAPNPAPEVLPVDGQYRYTREQLFDIYKMTPPNSIPVMNLFVEGWNPNHVNGNSSRNWGKNNDNHVPQDPSVCWDASGQVKPLGLEEMTDEQKELFNSDVNSPVKPPPQNKEVPHPGGVLNGRKASVSHGSSNFGLASPSSASRPGTRRRETGETTPFPGGVGLTSPTGNGRFSRDDPSPWFGRRSLEERDHTFQEPEEEPQSAREPPTTRPNLFGGITRTNATGAAAGNGGGSGFGVAPSSFWGSAAPAPSSLGAIGGGFGNFTLQSATSGDKRFGGASRGESRLARFIGDRDAGPSEDAASSKANEAPGAGANAGQSWRPRPRTDTDPFGEDGSSGAPARQQSTSPSSVPHTSLRSGAGSFETPVKGSAADYGMSGLNLGTRMEEGGSPQTNPYRSPPADRRDEEAGDAGGDLGASHAHGLVSEQQPSTSGFPISRPFHAPAAVDGSDRSQTSSAGGQKGFPPLTGGWPTGLTSATPDRERGQFSNPFGNTLFSPEVQSPSALGSIGNMFGPPSAPVGAPNRSKLTSLFPAALRAEMHQQAQQERERDGAGLSDFRQVNNLGAIGRSVTGPSSGDLDSPLRTGRGGFGDLFPDQNRSQSIFTSAEQTMGLTSVATSQPPVSSFTSAAATAGPSAGSLTSATPLGPTQADNSPPEVPRMVLPDRMRWVYLDPHGIVQGAFTGLQMNEWYKANFFTTDLRVRRVEDPEFEPLGQLIRRIGNSREPFLVPQIGIPHGPPPPQNDPFGNATSDPRGGVVPPLSGAFPSFGRTLTAEEQNNLERRKQEEQYNQHRHRELLAQQQQSAFNRAVSGGVLNHHSSNHSLQSQPSFGNITSPIGMPTQGIMGMGAGLVGPASAAAVPGGGPSYFEHLGTSQSMMQPAMATAPLDYLPDDLRPAERQLLASMQAGGGLSSILSAPQPSARAGPAPVGAPAAPGSHGAVPPSSGDVSLRSQLPSIDQLQQDPQGFSARIKEFHDLRALRDAEDASASGPGATKPAADRDSTADSAAASASVQQRQHQQPAQTVEEATKSTHESSKKAGASQSSTLSLTQQVQKAQAAAAKQAQPEEGMPMPFPAPAPQQGTPIAAPTAQSIRSTLPDLFAVSRSQSGTPESLSAAAAQPPLAPWARDIGSESQKGPNFKEIQDAEAKKAQRAELAASNARRQALELEAAAIREREKAANAGVAPILPTSSTWGNGSPVTASGTASPWSKPAGTTAAAKPSATSSGGQQSSKKKTMTDILHEEELAKQRLARAQHQAAAVSAATAPAANMGKRYADLASKTGAGAPVTAAAAAATAAASGGGWTPVGAGGKPKIPTGPAAQQPRTASTGNAKPAVAAPPAGKPAPRAVTAPSKAEAIALATEEVNRWARRELQRGGLLGGVEVDNIIGQLPLLGRDVQVIEDAVYLVSTKLDGRHFAQEYIRRCKQADKGVFEPAGASASSGTSGADNKGWSEVAKKGGSGGGGGGNSNNANSGAGGAGSLSGPFTVVNSRKRGKK